MADDRAKRNPQDNPRLNVHERYEVDYRTRKWGVTSADLEAAVKKVGVSAAAVARELGKSSDS